MKLLHGGRTGSGLLSRKAVPAATEQRAGRQRPGKEAGAATLPKDNGGSSAGSGGPRNEEKLQEAEPWACASQGAGVEFSALQRSVRVRAGSRRGRETQPPVRAIYRAGNSSSHEAQSRERRAPHQMVR